MVFIGDFMSLEKYKNFLEERKIDTNKIEASLSILEEFSDFLSQQNKTLENIDYEDLHSFSAYLIENNKNSYDNYISLLRYGYCISNNELIIAAMELIDGAEVIENFSKRLKEEFGEDIHAKVFRDLDDSHLGLHPKMKPTITKELIERFLSLVDEKKCEEFLAEGLRDKYIEYYKPSREKYLQSKNIDEFLKIKQKEKIQELEAHQREGTLYFTQEIDDSVIEYVKNNPSIETGVREGNQLILKKIPYMTKQYLAETDEEKRKYYYCHCPWVREALKDKDISPPDSVFCNCSAGYYKAFWEVVLDQPVKVKLLESILKGDKECKFALELPNEVVPN